MILDWHFLRRICGAFFIGLFVLLINIGTMAKDQQTLTWEALSPAMPDLRAPFKDLTDTQFADLHDLYKLMQWRKSDGAVDDSPLTQQIEELAGDLEARSMDTGALLRKLANAINEYEQIMQRPVAELNGRIIRLPGFVLPLEFGDAQVVSEFFLVPYVGACIHTPPPPANQIILVKLKRSYKAGGLYDPVWVTGRLKVVTNDRKLGYSDGVGEVASAYELEGMKIVPYQ